MSIIRTITNEYEFYEWLQDNTTVLELDNGHVVIQEFKS